VRLARPRRPKIMCSPSYADFRSRANTTRGLDFDHIMRWEHTGRCEDRQETPNKQDSIWCPQCKGTNAETLKQQKPIGEGDQELDKRLVREELISNVTQMYRKAMWVNSLYSYPYLN
jgi:hypothetical protein